MRRALLGTVLVATAVPGVVWAEAPPAVPALTREHAHPSGAFRFRTPDGWTEQKVAAEPTALQFAGDGMVVRFLFQNREVGYDGLHSLCMTQRLAESPQTDPWIEFEYDFLSGGIGDRRFLDSAFRVLYDEAILGEREFRQRNMTIVGAGQSLCIVVFVPSKLWKKSKPTRSLADAVVKSVEFK